MKTCSTCGVPKPVHQFNFRNRAKETRHSYCKGCGSSRMKAQYKKNKAYYKKKARLRVVEEKRRIRAYIVEHLKAHPCIDCGESDLVVLEFDHVRGIKRLNIAEMAHRRCSVNTVKSEIEKCDVRCANCHRRKTAKQFGWAKALL